jgi:SAM-dependent methyltransferase
MSHKEQQDYVRSVGTVFPGYFNRAKVLEVGSLYINGTVRVFFTECDYLGIDVGQGPGVDLVCQGQDLDHADGTYDTCISCECFEHNPFWVETFRNMHRMTKPNGMIIMTCATTGRLEHGTRRTTPHDAPLIEWDYYRNLTAADFRQAFDLDSMFKMHYFAMNTTTHDLYFCGIKKAADE